MSWITSVYVKMNFFINKALSDKLGATSNIMINVIYKVGVRDELYSLGGVDEIQPKRRTRIINSI